MMSSFRSRSYRQFVCFHLTKLSIILVFMSETLTGLILVRQKRELSIRTLVSFLECCSNDLELDIIQRLPPKFKVLRNFVMK